MSEQNQGGRDSGNPARIPVAAELRLTAEQVDILWDAWARGAYVANADEGWTHFPASDVFADIMRQLNVLHLSRAIGNAAGSAAASANIPSNSED